MRATRTWLPLVAAGVLALGACGTDDGADDSADDPGAAGQPDAPDDRHVEVVVGGEPDAVAPEHVPDDSAFAERAELLVAAWPDPPEDAPDVDETLFPVVDVDEAAPADTTLTVQVGHGDCDVAWGGWVTESDELVVLATWSVRDPDAEMCTERLLVEPVDVSLDQPLGDRALVDATTGEDPRTEE